MFKVSGKAGAIGLLVFSSIYPQLSSAGPDDPVTIGDVAAMSSEVRIQYVHRAASRRGLEIGNAEGDAVLGCLRRELLGIELSADGDYILPRGLGATIQLIHRHNNNGGEGLDADQQIREIVDLVAHHACGVELKSVGN